jgi:thimet oligopeptidase
VKKGLLDLTQKMYGLEYKEVPAKAWHADVTAYEVWFEGKIIGKFYLDLYSRPDKYKHAACSACAPQAPAPTGRYRTPMAALECNFPKPGAGRADVPRRGGDVLPRVRPRAAPPAHASELASYAGTNTVRDFVEAPSQMFEEWAWSREVLDLFAKHHKTGERRSPTTSSPRCRSRAPSAARSRRSGSSSSRRWTLEYHEPRARLRHHGVLEEVQTPTTSFPT